MEQEYGPADASVTRHLLLQQNPEWFILLARGATTAQKLRGVKWDLEDESLPVGSRDGAVVEGLGDVVQAFFVK